MSKQNKISLANARHFMPRSFVPSGDKTIRGGCTGISKMKFLYNNTLTKFQWQVLKAASRIPLGETRSYKWVAAQIGRPKAARAVGQALKRNPYPLIIPCHRVIRQDGRPGGYAGKYSSKKARLLYLEKEIKLKIERMEDTSPMMIGEI